MYGEVFGAVAQAPGLRVFPRLDPPLPTPGQYDVELVLQSDAPAEQMLEATAAVLGAGWQSGKFLYVDTDLKIDLPQARVVLDRERLADLGLDLASVGRELGTLLGGAYEFPAHAGQVERSEEHTSELQSRQYLVCRALLEKKNEEC